MRPVIRNLHPLSDAQLDAVEREVGVTLPPALRAVLREVNGGVPEPRDVPCREELVGGETDVPVYEFCRWDDPVEYARLCRTYHDELSVPRSLLPFAHADADTFFVDVADPTLRVLYWQYLEGDYASAFQGDEAPCVSQSLTVFMESFFDRDAQDTGD